MEDELEQKSRQPVIETRLQISTTAEKTTSCSPEKAENGNDSVGELDGSSEGGDLWSGTDGNDPLISPRGRGYLARLVLEVCTEIEENKKVRYFCIFIYFCAFNLTKVCYNRSNEFFKIALIN